MKERRTQARKPFIYISPALQKIMCKFTQKYR